MSCPAGGIAHGDHAVKGTSAPEQVPNSLLIFAFYEVVTFGMRATPRAASQARQIGSMA